MPRPSAKPAASAKPTTRGAKAKRAKRKSTRAASKASAPSPAPRSGPETNPAVDRAQANAPVLDGPIALSLSGGGFRAAAFHVGVLTALQRAGLLERVEILSASSAGSIVAARILFARARDESYEHAAFDLKRFLCEERPLDAALQSAARTGKSLTAAFADELDRALFSDKRGVSNRLQTLNESRTHVREGSFEAVSLLAGRPFRFAFSRAHEAGVGRPTSFVPRRVAEQIRIADAVAASCADLETLEPHCYPDDFDWGNEESAAQAREAAEGNLHPLAGGALHDDLAIDGLLGATTRDGNRASLFLASDAAWTERQGDASVPRELPRWLTLARLDALALLFGLGAIAAGALVWIKARQEHAIGDFRFPGDLIAYGIPLLFCATIPAALLVARMFLKHAFGPFLSIAERAPGNSVRRTPLSALARRLHARERGRLSALVRLVPGRMRGLVLRGGWSEGGIALRRATLQPAPLRVDSLDLVENLRAPGHELIATTERARAVRPGLKLENEDAFRALACAGEAALIARLIELIELRHGPDRAHWPAQDRVIGQRLMDDWEQLSAEGRALRPLADER